ncbi:14511_t:CDS:2, partial [Acaulospora morrowiae]
FISYVANNTPDKKWKKATSILNDGLLKREVRLSYRNNHISGLATCLTRNGVIITAQGNDAQMFWNTVKLEIGTMKLSSIFCRLVSILNEMIWVYVESEGSEIRRRVILETSFQRSFPMTQYYKNHHLDRILFSSSEDENDNLLMVDNNSDEEIPALDVILSSQSINHIEILQNKEKLTTEEKVTLRYGASRVIDLSTHMRVWFTETERQDMMKDYNEILKIPKFI